MYTGVSWITVAESNLYSQQLRDSSYYIYQTAKKDIDTILKVASIIIIWRLFPNC